MKTTKRIFASLLAVMLMVALMVVPASAAGPYSITIDTHDEGHAYEAYQIFAGTLDEVTIKGVTSYVLSNITWGNGVDATKIEDLGDAQAVSAGLTDEASAHAFAEKLVSEEYLSADPTGTSEGDGPYTISGLEAGYYLVKDVSDSIDADEYHAYTDYILRVVKNTTVAPKASVPSLIKRVSTSDGVGYAQSISAAIGHDVFFELNASMPSLIGTYTTYKMTFVDTLPAGLDYEEGSVKVYTNNDNNLADLEEIEEGFSVSYNNRVLTVTVTDAIASILETEDQVMVSDNIVVRFAAKLNSNAVVGVGQDELGNKNTAVLQYSNDPNNGASYGTTTEEDAQVYTYSLQVVKVDSNNRENKLSGAQFRLWRYEGASVTDKRFAIANDNGDGTYTITGVTSTESEGTIFTTDANGQFTAKGVNSGTYRLTEVTPPVGYNKLTDNAAIQLVANLNATSGKVDSFSANKADTLDTTVSADNYIATLTIANKSGATLPETGGMGTTILYIVGAALMIGAGTVLVTKKRNTQK
ncbi:MAG: isopeptide-forming domain-containing fimbrial protein [Ruminococcaceae bacterium]|nr:isopeptide-forming domain-containing fimbrial protein [Oscillospiraceae bacterium]